MRFTNSAHHPFGIAALAAIGLVLSGSACAAQNLVTNGNFGTGDYSGWTLAGDSDEDYIVGPDSTNTYAAALTTDSDDTGTLSQSIATIVGTEYTVTYNLAGDGATPNSFTAAFGGTTLDSETNVPDDQGTTQFFVEPPESYTFVANATSSDLVFTYSDAPGYLYLSNVSVTANAPTSPTPEPSSFATLVLLSVGLGGLIIRARRTEAVARAPKLP